MIPIVMRFFIVKSNYKERLGPIPTRKKVDIGRIKEEKWIITIY